MAGRLHSFASGRPSSCQYLVTWKETHLDPAHTYKGRLNLWQGVRRFLGKSPVPLSSWPRWGCINLWQGVRRVFRQGSCPPCVWNIWSTYRCHWVLIDLRNARFGGLPVFYGWHGPDGALCERFG